MCVGHSCNKSAATFMKKHAASPDELDLFQLAEAGRELDQRRKALEDSQRKAEAERRDHETTLPPSDVVSARQRQKQHDAVVSRNEVRNVRREQGKALLLLALLIAMTATLVWWGLKLMHGS
jgi:ferric-dicitrate binding protein FerR (iron transport regulator)